MVWDELVKIALLGTEHNSLNPKVERVLIEKGIDNNKEATATLLEALAYFSTIKKAGWQPSLWKGKPLVKSKENNGLICSSKSTVHLRIIINSYPQLLTEFIQQLKKNKKLLPYEELPNLFDRSVKDEMFWEQIAPIIGERGKWLLLINPAWRLLSTNLDKELWKVGTKVERLALLKLTRRKNPPQGLALLQTTWTEDSLAEKIAFLKCLNIGLSVLDEPFLESCLKATRKEIRIAAAELLLRLPKSSLQHNIQTQLSELINFDKKKDTISIVEAPSKDNILLHIGIIPKRYKENEWYLLEQMTKIVPPIFWERHLNKPPNDIIKLFIKTDSSLKLVNALIESIACYPSKQWIEVVLRFWLSYKEDWGQLVIDPILVEIPNDLYNSILCSELSVSKTLPKEHTPIIQLLSLKNQKWNKQLTFLFFNQLKEWIYKNASISWQGRAYKAILKECAAYVIDPKWYAQIVDFWQRERTDWTGWESDIHHFLAILNFRKEVLLELSMK